MPIRIVGRGENVVIDRIVVEQKREVLVFPILGVGEMHRNADAWVKRTHGGSASSNQCIHSGPICFAAETVGGFVADLHHAHIHTRILERFKRLLHIGTHRLRFLLHRHIGPGLWGLLLRGVRPKIGKMKIDKEFHAVLRRTLADCCSGVYVAVAAAVAVAACVKRVVPYAHADVVDARLLHGQKRILRGTVEAVVGNAAVLKRNKT